MSQWKKTLMIPALVFAVAVPPALAIDQDQIARQPTENEILADGLIARPLGLIATAIGAATFVVTLPFSIPSNSIVRAASTLVVEPARYTFKRPLGQFDSCHTLPESCR